MHQHQRHMLLFIKRVLHPLRKSVQILAVGHLGADREAPTIHRSDVTDTRISSKVHQEAARYVEHAPS